MERIEDLQLKGLRIFRRDDLPGYTTDSVLLADFVKAKSGDCVCDFGTGTGIIPLLLIGRLPSVKVTGIEIVEELAVLAAKSAALNDLEQTMRIIHGDIREISKLVSPNSFQVIVCNPPYFCGKQGSFHTHQLTCNEQDMLKAVRYALMPRGTFFTCCPADRFLLMADVMRENGLAPKRVRFVSSRADKAPYLVLIEGKLGAKPGYVMMPQLVALNAHNEYTPEMKTIYHMNNEDTP